MGIRKSELINIQEVGEEIRLIPTSDNYYISENGNVYHRVYKNFLYKRILDIRPDIGYVYCSICYNGRAINKRVHVLLAKAFISNPNNYPIVGHIDNIKHHNWIDNLEWCTVSHNTQKAYSDGLAKNTNSYSDSQSMPVIMYETSTDTSIFKFGSISEAARWTDIDKSTIARQCKDQRPIRLPFYFRYNKNVSATTIENYDGNIVSRVVVTRV